MSIEGNALRGAIVTGFGDDNILASIHAVVEAYALETPDAVALKVCDEASAGHDLTYADLDARANALARYLVDTGVRPGAFVGVAVPRSAETIIALLAVLKTGAAYMPLNSDLPADRVRFMIEDSGASLVLTAPGHDVVLPETVQEVDLSTAPEGAPDTALPVVSPEDAAYLIYTSGSSGKPKGVIVPHRGIVHLARRGDFAKMDRTCTFIQISTIIFDASVYEIWAALLNGARLVLPKPGIATDLPALKQALRDEKVTTLFLTTALLNTLVDADLSVFDTVSEVLTGGEALSLPHAAKLKDRYPDIHLVNCYGPTEASVMITTWQVSDPASHKVAPIGRAVGDNRLYLVDEALRPIEDDTPGELVVAGASLAIGYLNRPEINDTAFVAAPELGEERVYRTGDLVRRLEDGSFTYCGRIDTQVKLSGHRIELGEIETALKSHPEIMDAAVIVVGEGEARRLAAFVTGTDALPNDSDLRDGLARDLPDYMVPAIFERRDALPLTATGKIDRRALKVSKRKRPALSQAYAAPKGMQEKFIAETWEELLDVEGIGRQDRFFELGGSSLDAMRAVEIFRSEKGFDLSIAAFFDMPTVENLGRIWAEQGKVAAPAIVTEAPRERATGNEKIAIIGVAARTSGAETADELWEMLIAGRSGRVDVTAEDLIALGQDPAQLDDPDYVPSAYPLKDHEGFDTKFFGFTPREVQLMDPQQRLMLEAAWMVLENAGHDTRQGGDRIGVFGGVGRNAYQLENLMSHKTWRDLSHDYSVMLGNERDFACTHVAYRLGLTGPAMTVQTGCSTSGVAIHMAAQSLINDECDIALAGGAKFLVPHRAGYMYTEGGALNPDGKIKAFDHRANGMIRGSGVAMLAMKRLDEALEDGDHIYSVLIGSALNNDGGNSAGFTAPSSGGQADAIAEAISRAGISAETIGLIEAHGTGTNLGDPIEIEGLTRAFARTTDKKQFCAIGSIKTNIAHLDAGATAAGLVKASLALKNEAIPPSLNFEAPNPRIPFENTPLFVADKRLDWARSDAPRRAGVSSFGLGGTNAHIVVEEAPLVDPSDAATGPQLFVLSGRTETALARRADDLANWLEANPEANIADVAWTLLSGRRRMEKRLAFIADSRDDLIAKLRARNPREMIRSGLAAESADVAFLFAGGGAQYPGMAMGLYDWAPAFREALDRLDAYYKGKTGESLIGIIRTSDTLEATTTALPALFAVEYAMAEQWRAWGTEPAAMIGHSMGEYAAAAVAGVFSPEHGLDIVMTRGRLFDTLDEGSMLSVPMAAEALEPRLGEDLAIAAINAEGQCVVSGPVAAIEALAADLEQDEVESRRVHIAVAAHSPMVEPILEEFRAAFDAIDLNAPKLPFVSNVTGTWITDDEATDPDYWVRHLRGTVRFADGIGTLLENDDRMFLELGPGQVLSTLTRQHSAKSSAHEVSATIRHPKEADADPNFLLTAVGKAWLAGADLTWKSLVPGRRLKVALPVYRFERERQWIDAKPYPEDLADGTVVAPAPMQDSAPAPAPVAEAAEIPAEIVAEPEPAPEPEGPRRDQILAQLKGIVHDLSGVPLDEIDEFATFLELGFDSLFLTQANAAFKKAFKVKLSTRQLMEELPVLDAVATYLDEKMPASAPVATPAQAAPKAAAPATAAPVQAAPEAPKTLAPISAETQAAIDALEAKTETGAVVANVAVPTIDRADKADLTEAQQAHIDEIIAETLRRTPSAKASTQASRRVLADPRTIQGFKSRWKEIVYPVLSDKAKGSRVWDTDGNEYIDLVGGYGVTFLGHQPDFIVDAIREQTSKSLAIGPQTPLAGEVARKISDMTGMERVAFCNTGSEAVLAGVRMARTVTGKDKIVKFDGHYHGIFDEMQVRSSGQGSRLATFPSAPGIPEGAVQNTIIVDYGDPEAFDVIRENVDDIALVLVEPVRSRNPDFQPIAYVQALRKLTRELGIPMLFDEMITGFRSHPQGAQHFYGIEADIATYGKVVGGGLPIGVVAGSAEYMDTLDGGFWDYGDDSAPPADMTWFAGTFVRHPMALATAKATIDHLQDKGPALQDGVNALARRFADEMNAYFAQVNVAMKMECFSSVLRLTFTQFTEYADLVFFHMRNRGIMTYEGRPMFLSTAHTEADMDAVRDAYIDSINTLIEVGLIKGTRPDGSRVIPLAPSQQEIWVATQFSDDASCSYNLCSTIELKGKLDRGLLEEAINALITRHEALRALPQADGATQVIRAPFKVPFKISDFSLQSPERRLQDRVAAEDAEVQTPFDFTKGPLIRAHLMKLGTDHHKLLLTVHHIIADGMACGIMVRELGEIYAALRDGREADLPAANQLTDYLAYLSAPDTIEARAEAQAYWQDLYKAGVPRVEFPSDRPRPRDRAFAARRATTHIPATVSDALTDLAKTADTTMFAGLISAFGAYLTKITGAPESALGFAAAGQPLMGAAPLVSHCVTFLPLRVAVDTTVGFAELMRETGGGLLDALENQNFDFVSFVKEIDADRDLDWAPLVSIGVNLDAAAKEAPFADFEAVTDSVGRQFESLDLFVNFVKTEDGVEFQCTYNTALFDGETMEQRMLEYQTFLEQAVARPEAPIAELEVLTSEERADLATWAGQTTDYPKDRSVADLFRDMARDHGSKPALIDPLGDAVSYDALEASAVAWASVLVDQGVRPGDFVGLCMTRSPRMIVALLAILKAGGVYVPFETTLPDNRLAFILEDCGARHILSEEGLDIALPKGVARIDVGAETPVVDAALPETTGGETPAYLMYTSGSTGTPKGVLVPHQGITRLVKGTDYARFDDSRVFLQLAPVGFDAATFEIWGALLNGAALVVPPPALSTDTEGLKATIATHGVTTLWLTAALFNTVVDSDPLILEGVEELLTGGEALSVTHVRKAMAALPGTRLINGYGPTENTTFTCTWPITELPDMATSVPIGRPIANTRAYIVDATLAPVPQGVPGELVVAGDGLALGYLNRPELNEDVFVAAPALGEARIYRTGDFCRFGEDGVIEFIGRRDGQIKIRGFRVEPGEIEAAMADLPGVDQAAVIYSPERAALFGFYVDTETTDPQDLMVALRDQLPRHMVPARMIRMDSMPVTQNGKLDRKALTDSLSQLSDETGRPLPLRSSEVGLAAIWRDLLGVETVYADENFFEMGGHSLMSVQLFDRVRAQFGVKMPISTLFGAPTIQSLAAAIEKAQASLETEIDPASDWDPSVVIHAGPEASDQPFFIVGGAGGNVNNLAELGRIVGQNRKVVGFQTRGVMGHTPHATIEAMAADNLTYLRQHQPEGPVVLAGYSAGATTAFEMACQLEARGEKVAALILIDSMAPGFSTKLFDPAQSRSPFDATGRRVLAMEARMLFKHGPKLLKAWRDRKDRQEAPAQTSDTKAVKLKRHTEMVKAWFAASRHYVPGRFGGRADLLTTRPSTLRSKLFVESYPNYGWDQFIGKDRITRHEMSTDEHSVIVYGEYAKEMAGIIEEAIEKA